MNSDKINYMEIHTSIIESKKDLYKYIYSLECYIDFLESKINQFNSKIKQSDQNVKFTIDQMNLLKETMIKTKLNA